MFSKYMPIKRRKRKYLSLSNNFLVFFNESAQLKCSRCYSLGGKNKSECVLCVNFIFSILFQLKIHVWYIY